MHDVCPGQKEKPDEKKIKENIRVKTLFVAVTLWWVGVITYPCRFDIPQLDMGHKSPGLVLIEMFQPCMEHILELYHFYFSQQHNHHKKQNFLNCFFLWGNPYRLVEGSQGRRGGGKEMS